MSSGLVKTSEREPLQVGSIPSGVSRVKATIYDRSIPTDRIQDAANVPV